MTLYLLALCPIPIAALAWLLTRLLALNPHLPAGLAATKKASARTQLSARFVVTT